MSTLPARLPSSGRMVLLWFMFLGFVAMFVVSFNYRLHNSLVEDNTERQSTGRGVNSESAAGNSATPAMGFNLSEKQSGELSQLMAKLQTNPNDAATLTGLGEFFMQAQDWARAQVFLSRAMISSPQDTQVRHMLGITQFRLGDFARSAELFEGILEMHYEPPAAFNLALLYKYHLNAPDKAKALFTRVAASPDADETLVEQAKKELAGK